jgi:superfamily II DNA/RNA helicase
VFLSTDAGGVGLNLQSASLVINLDIPWNPAILEQRIGRIYRHGQKRKVNVINLVSKGSIEERLLDVLAFKSSLFAGVLDDGSDQIFMGESKFKQFMLSVEEVAVTPAEPVSATDTEEIDQEETATRPVATTPSESTAQFINSAGAFFDSLARTLADKQSTEQLISTLVEKDQVTGKTYLKIPVENERIVTTALEALTGLLSALKK